MFDAYTVKKVLPRLAIAVILIQLSWFLTTGAIFITNKIAFGIEGLMYGAFGGSANFTLDTLLSSTSSSSATTIGLSVLFVVAGTAFGGGVIAIAGFIIIAVIVAFLSLAVRRAILILLVLLSPIAIVCWILPNTERFWKMWWDNFTKLLIMFPLIMAMIAAGRIFAKISGSTGSSDIVKVTIVIAGFFVPLLLIPKTFALAGSAFAAMGGAIAQRGAGAQNWAQGMGKNRQKKKWAKRGQDFTAGNLAKTPATRFGRGINRLGARVGADGGFALRKAKRHSAMDVAATTNAEKIKQSEEWKGIMFDDDAMRALTYGGKSEAHAALMAMGKTKEEADVAVAKAARVGFGQHNAVAAAQQMVANKTGFADALDATDTINRVAGNNAVMRTSMREAIKFTGKQVGRSDLGGLSEMKTGETRDEYRRRMTLAGAATADTYTLGKNHDIGLGNITRETAAALDDVRVRHAAAVAAGDTVTATRIEQEAGELWGTAKDILDAKGYTSGSGANLVEGFEQASAQTGEYLDNIVSPTSPVGPAAPVAVRDPADPNNWIYVPGQQPVISVRQQAEKDHARRESIDPRDPRLNP